MPRTKAAPSTVPSSTAAARALTCSMFMKQLCIRIRFCCFSYPSPVLTVEPVLTHLVTGLLTGWSLIIAVGPQNALLLRQGIRRAHLAVVVTSCSLADVLRIGPGAVGTGAGVLLPPWARAGLRGPGVADPLGVAGRSLKSSREASGQQAD